MRGERGEQMEQHTSGGLQIAVFPLQQLKVYIVVVLAVAAPPLVPAALLLPAV